MITARDRDTDSLTLPGLADAAWCGRIAAESAAGPGREAGVYGGAAGRVVDKKKRRCTIAEVSSSTASELQRIFSSVIPALEEHFAIPLAGCTAPQVLLYSPGEEFALHRDTARHPETPAHIRARRLTGVLFLNAPGAAYTGGALEIYGGALRGAAWELTPRPLPAGAGTLVVFPSSAWHRVAPVEGGRRCTAVAWYFGPHPGHR
jgi:predicted 2-oxoglutarate/Fe(II)-dependent dioxygenase YbiX